MFQRGKLLLIAVPILCAGLVAALDFQPTQRQVPIENEPVLVFDVTGSTLLGPVHRHLAVYDSGRVSYATSGPRAAQPFVATATIEPKRVQALMGALSGAGAWQGIDQELGVTDVPLTTVTVLSGATDASAHTFSYWTASTRTHKSVQDLIAAFVTEVFPTAGSPFTTPGG